MTKVVDICFSKNKNKINYRDTSKDNKENDINNNNSLVTFDSINISILSNLNEIKSENINNKNINPIFELNQD